MKYTPHVYTHCEKCGNENIYEGGQWSSYIYECSRCNFKKTKYHVGVGFYFKFPNYFSITDYAAYYLFYDTGTRLSLRIDRSGIRTDMTGTHLSSPGRIKNAWDRWIRENPVAIVNLAAISDKHMLGCDPKVKPGHNPINYLINDIKEQKGNYLNFVIPSSTIKTIKNITKVKIAHAVEYGIKKCSDIYWIGNKPGSGKYLSYLRNSGNRNHKLCREISISDNAINVGIPQRTSYTPAYISGANIFHCLKIGYTQDKLDKHIYELMTAWDNKLSEGEKLRVIINTGNTGVDTSVIRWAVDNKRYAIVVNIPEMIYQDENGKTVHSTQEQSIHRLMNITVGESIYD